MPLVCIKQKGLLVVQHHQMRYIASYECEKLVGAFCNLFLPLLKSNMSVTPGRITMSQRKH